ncbi:MAG: hypothetical protein JO308_11450, partial [Verrucomicrobia bacterium]|nr:hypothetical protein [Verrucomicrobiota bacterium]
GGLRQIAVHIDLTQRGRAGRIRQRLTSELELNPIREAFTQLVRAIRARTGLPLELAHNCTVTEANLGSIPNLVRWFLADPDRTRIWRNLSFLPEANTGRTISSGRRATPQQVWEAICSGLGVKISGHTLIGGHPDCNQGATLLVSRRTGKFLPMTFPDRQTEALFAKMLSKLGAVSTMTTDADPVRTGGKTLLAWRVAGALARQPLLVGKVACRLVALIANREIPLGLSADLLSGHAHTVTVGTHNFMDAEAVAQAESDPVVRTRLQACVFKGAVRNGKTGEWETVPMCSMNQSRWREVLSAPERRRSE